MKRKKPTSKEVQRVIESLIMQVLKLEETVLALSSGFVEYIEFKKDSKKFDNYLKKKEKVNVRKKSSRKSSNGK